MDNVKIKQLREQLQKNILVLDGAMGTTIQNLNLTAKDFGGANYEGCNEYLNLTRPDAIQKIHEDFLAAGCDIIETNTFGSTPLVLGEYDLTDKADDINIAAAKLAQAAVKKYSTKDKPRFVAGSVGPTTKAISVTGGIDFPSLEEQFYRQAEGLVKGGVDYLLLETCQDTRNVKAGLFAIDRLSKKLKQEIPVALSVTIEPTGTMLAGQAIDALYASVAHLDLLYIGLNCATGPEFMTDHIRSLSEFSRFAISCVPNAGLPDENGCYLETPEMVGAVLERFLQKGWLNVIGGCCGTHKGHIQHLCEIAKKYKPRQPVHVRKSFLSGIDYLELVSENRPYLVGERTNVIGSKKFKTLITEEKFDEASEIARSQVKSGAPIIDVCLANPDRDEKRDMTQFLDFAIHKVKAPFMIDSTDEKVIESALTYCQGKAIINSINLEDGEERFEKVLPLVKKYGAAVVVGTIDDDPNQGMGVTRARKLQIAEREYDLLTKKYGLPEEDIYWDPLVFPCGTGDQQYVGSAVETIEGIRLIKEKYPRTKTILGISNVSFGLPTHGREVLNSVFLYHCVNAGLDLAIVNSEKLVRYPSISKEDIQICDDLIFSRGADPVAKFAEHFRKRTKKTGPPKQTLPLLERLPRYILEGTKDGLIDDLNEALKNMVPLEIINGPLMAGMDEVGKLFNQNKLIVAEVLQSAEAMKHAVRHLENFMEKSETSVRGKVILATVKGDVHDIGKNLVEIILANNGFHVVNLGIKVPPEQLIQAVKDHKPDMIGLSGLLVKSAQQMAITAEDLQKAGISVPMVVGGAALTENFVDRQIASQYGGLVAYASDAMSGLDIAKQIVDTDQVIVFQQRLEEKRKAKLAAVPTVKVEKIAEGLERATTVPVIEKVPTPADFERHVIKNTPIETIWNFINPLMLYGRHLGMKGEWIRKFSTLKNPQEISLFLSKQDPKAHELFDTVEAIKQAYKNSPQMKPAAVYQFLKSCSFQNTIYALKGHDLIPIAFPRQKKKEGLCIADYLNPSNRQPSKPSELTDNFGMFLVTVGTGVREETEKLKLNGEYLKSHILSVLALESAEAYAEFLHSQLRRMWGFGDDPAMTMMDRFQAKYRGKRYSFGYPACPRLDDQQILFDLLNPSEIGVELTEGFMMEPEASVSALAFHHPAASYFSVGVSGASDGT